MSAARTNRGLRAGIVTEIARAAGVEVGRSDRKCPIRCPLHEDRHPSAFLDPEHNSFFCSVCTPNGTWTAKQLANACGVAWPPPGAYLVDGEHELPQVAGRTTTFSATQARDVWRMAITRALDDEFAGADAVVYEYARRRGLLPAWEDRLFGILSTGMKLPASVASWPSTEHRLVAPLYDSRGEVACVQARRIVDGEPRTLFPRGSAARATLFACARGVQVLRSTWPGERQVVYGEGLTDYLALACASPLPVLCAPGTSMASSGIGPWIEGHEVLLALDWDEAGELALKPTATAAYERGAKRVQRLEWPDGCADACEVIERRGLEGLREFLCRPKGGPIG